MDKNMVIVCLPLAAGTTKGSESKCCICGVAIWISDTSIDAIKAHKENKDIPEDCEIQARCLACSIEILREDINSLPYTIEQLEEIRDHFKNG